MALTKATLQLQMEGIVDPETQSPLPLECAIQKGLIGSEEVYQALSKQVAEGGIIHHASGTRLSVSDALERGLVDRSLAPGLEELQSVYNGNVSLLSHPAALFQASTGAIFSPESGRKLTLTEAVSKGLLEEKVAKDAMASAGVTQGVIDPQSSRVVPYSDLVNQGKIDLNTGKRFLEVKPFSGIHDEQTGDKLTLNQAIAIGKVDPVPALRLLQSQADSGGIIDVNSGDRLSLPEAAEKGLIEDDMARVIAINQITKGGLIHPATGQRVASLDDAIIAGLISSEMAFDIQDSRTSVEIDEGEGSSTPVISSNSTYSPVASLASSQAKWSAASSVSTSPLIEQPEKDLVITKSDHTQLDSVASNQLALCDATIEEETVAELMVEKQPITESDSSIDLLAKFASNVGKRIQQAIDDIKPQNGKLKPAQGAASTIGVIHAVRSQKESRDFDSTAVQPYQEPGPGPFNTTSQVQLAEQSRASVDQPATADKVEARPVKDRVLSVHDLDDNDETVSAITTGDVPKKGELKGEDVLSLKQVEKENTKQRDETRKRDMGVELKENKTQKESRDSDSTAVQPYQEPGPGPFNTTSQVQLAEQSRASVDQPATADKVEARPVKDRVLSVHDLDDNDETVSAITTGDVPRRENSRVKMCFL
ncbi:hypothetical protein NHX12_024073 [Muraenolepis orangiensis]|uniref:Uncharacterized protein n=1 Tax=Muraenolepis orangiensis TaxID=630683 RepID=A0A9Q0ITD6_9TELE|nr:hypothetical protein NHX12_024073 [Muraenolepis orangiensis]